ncbi:MAG: hypothetical protein ACLPN1_15905, partial [Dissulfurispiraceae bacterium]
KLLSKQLFISKVIDIDGHYRFTVGRNESGREYQLVDDFTERMLKVLLEMQKSAKGGSTIRFLQNGFELSINAKSSGESMRVMEDILRELIEKLREGPDGSRVLRQMV